MEASSPMMDRAEKIGNTCTFEYFPLEIEFAVGRNKHGKEGIYQNGNVCWRDYYSRSIKREEAWIKKVAVVVGGKVEFQTVYRIGTMLLFMHLDVKAEGKGRF